MKRLILILCLIAGLSARAMDSTMVVNLTETAINCAFRFGGVTALKQGISSMRPDGSTDNSFPSRHSVWAYGIGTTAAIRLTERCEWLGVGIHTLANGVGVQRVMSMRHWPGDVMAGACYGIGLSIAANALANKIFGMPHPFGQWQECSTPQGMSVSAHTRSYFPISGTGGEYGARQQIVGAIRLNAPLHRSLGIAVDVSVGSGIIGKSFGHMSLSRIGVMAGPLLTHRFGLSPWSVEAAALVGIRHNFISKSADGAARPSVGSIAPAAAFDLTGMVMLTPAFGAGVEMGYDYSSVKLDGKSSGVSSLTAGFVTRVYF